MRLSWSVEARSHLIEIADFIALDDPVAAKRWIARLRDRARRAARMPNAARRVPELDNDDIREVMHGNYRIIYRIEPRRIVVQAVTEGHRPLRL